MCIRGEDLDGSEDLKDFSVGNTMLQVYKTSIM
jgi:hypothetical protein